MHNETSSVVVIRAVVGGGVQRYADDLIGLLGSLDEAPRLRSCDARPPFSALDQLAIRRSARAPHVVLVHSTHLQTPRVKVPSVVTVHDVLPLDLPGVMPGYVRRRIFGSLLRTTLREAAKVIVPSEMTASALFRHGAARERVVVVPEGPSELFKPCTDEERTSARERFAGGAPYVAAIWNRRPHKNCLVLGDVGRGLNSAGISLVCAGPDRPPQGGPAYAGFLGDTDLRLFYGGAEAFILPSLAEGFGLPAVESLACGTPVVCGPNIGALPHLNDGAVITDITAPRALLGAVLDLVRDDRGRVRTAASTPSFPTARSMAAETVAVYREVIGA